MTLMTRFGFYPNDIVRLKDYTDAQICKEIAARKRDGQFTDFTLLGYSDEKLRTFMEHRNELIEEYSSSFAEIHQGFVEDERREFYGLDLDD